MAELGSDDSIGGLFVDREHVGVLDWCSRVKCRLSHVSIKCVGFEVGVRLLSFPLFEYVTKFIFGTEETYPLASITHAWLEDPPLPVYRVFLLILSEAILEFVSFKQGFVKEFSIVELEVDCRLDMILEEALRMLDKPARNCIGQEVLSDKSFTDNVGIC